MDCIICYKSHATDDCPDITPNHCPDCHMYIRVYSDHTPVCGLRTWIYNKYARLYASPTKERCIISIDTPFRFWKDSCWRKGNDGLEMYSSVTGAFFQYKSEHDLSLSSNAFVGIRIAIVIKDSDHFHEKLLLLTSMTKLMVAKNVDKKLPQNGNYASDRNTTLVLAMSAQDNPTVQINVFPKNKPSRCYVIRYDQLTKQFRIPDGLNSQTSSSFDEGAASMYAQIDNQGPQIANQGPQSLVKFHFDEVRNRIPQLQNPPDVKGANENCLVCFGAHHSKQCQDGVYSSCFECHTPIKNIGDHADACSIKHWFLSQRADKYVKIPSVRCAVVFEPPLKILIGNSWSTPQTGMRLFSAMSDTYYKFESDRKVIISTTAYTRIRLPVIVQVRPGVSIEKLVLMTSHDRSIVAAKGSRQVNDASLLTDYEHNTSLVLYAGDENPSLSLEVHGGQNRVLHHQIYYNKDAQKYNIPEELDVKSKHYSPLNFDAPIPKKKMR